MTERFCIRVKKIPFGITRGHRRCNQDQPRQSMFICIWETADSAALEPYSHPNSCRCHPSDQAKPFLASGSPAPHAQPEEFLYGAIADGEDVVEASHPSGCTPSTSRPALPASEVEWEKNTHRIL